MTRKSRIPPPLSRSRRLGVKDAMTITLYPDREAWLETRVANREFASVDGAERRLIGERIAERSQGEDDAPDAMAWTKPYIDEGLAALDRGEFVSLEDHKAHHSALLKSLKA